MDDEPLEEWAARRDARRRPTGERKAVPLDGEHGEHVNPQAPRGMLEWDGHQWIPTGVAENRTGAAEAAGQDATARAEAISLPAFPNLPPAPEPWRPTEAFRRP